MDTTPNRQFPPAGGDERSILVAWLEWQRATVHRKCAGLDDHATHERTIASSELTIASGLPLVSLRWILGHVLEETARHLGHLDLLREAADGQRGYQPSDARTGLLCQ